jgi:hypothetical protein
MRESGVLAGATLTATLLMLTLRNPSPASCIEGGETPRADAAVRAQRACPMTSPNLQGRLFPGAEGNHGNAGLSTWTRSPVVFKPGGPGCVAPDGSLLIKWPWWRGVRGQLAVTGRSLDGWPGAPRAAYVPYGGTGFQATAMVFPGAGCWEVTGTAGDASLSFVVLVEKIGAGPASSCEKLYPAAALRMIQR